MLKRKELQMLSDKKKEMKVARVLQLAKVYGPFVRFFPEGSEGEGEGEGKGEGGALDDAIKTGETAENKDNAEFEKTRQRADQEAANARKARDELSQSQGALDASLAEATSLKEQLAAAEARATEAGIATTELDESNYEGTDRALVRAIQDLNKKIEAKDKASTTEIAALKRKAADYEAQDRQTKSQQAVNRVYDDLLTDLDEEFGAENRNVAVAKFNQLQSEGEIPKSNPVKATRIMGRCYKEAKAARDKAKKEKDSSSSKNLALDSGSGGGSPPNLLGAEIKEGSLDDVAAQVSRTEVGGRKI